MFAFQIENGNLLYSSFLSTSTSTVNMSVGKNLDNGNWHNLTMVIGAKSLKLFLNGQKVGEELDSASVHDFLDPYLTKMYLGGVDRDYFSGRIETSSKKFVFIRILFFPLLLRDHVYKCAYRF